MKLYEKDMEQLNLERLEPHFSNIHRIDPDNPLHLQVWQPFSENWQTVSKLQTVEVRDTLIKMLSRSGSDSYSVMVSNWDDNGIRRILKTGLIPVNLAVKDGVYFFEESLLDGDRIVRKPLPAEPDPNNMEPNIAFMTLILDNEQFVADFRLHGYLPLWRRMAHAASSAAVHALHTLQFLLIGPPDDVEEQPRRRG